jgi:hypothetical protein
MAITLESYPAENSSVSSECLMVVSSTETADPVTYPNYKFVADVYVASVLIARLKAFPDPTNSLGVFDISKVLQPYFSTTFDGGSDKADYDVRLAYQVKLGHEYSDTLYTNLITDSTRYVANTYKPRPFTSSVVLANGLASNMPSVLTTLGNPITFQHIPYFSNVSGVADLSFVYKDAAGNTINSGSFDNSDFVANKLRVFNIENSSTQTDYILLTGPFSLRINYKCTKYPIRYIAWLNPFGGYESQTFSLVSKKSIETERKTFSRLPYEISSGGDVSYLANSVYYGGRKGFATNTKTKLKLTSHLLSDDEYEWLADLFISPEVYYSIDGSNWIPVQVTTNAYEYRTYLNSRLTPLEFEVDFADDFNGQFL